MSPFTENPSDQISSIGENALLRYIQEWLGGANPPSPRGIGDDTAVLPVPATENLILTNDSLIWERHFDETASAFQAGAKLLKRNLSDIAAMGGEPLHSLVAINCGEDVSLTWLSQFFDGLSQVALEHQCEINGGDVSQSASGSFSATLTLLGKAGKPVRRQGGEENSWVWSTGVLGGSILGHHLSFQPRLPEGQWLGNRSEVLAMMDTTDGLARDLPKMIPDGLQARIDLALVPVGDGARASAQDSGKPAVWHAFTDGEDYELIFITRPETDANSFESDWNKSFKTPLSAIGTLKTTPTPNGSTPTKLVGLDGGSLFEGEGFEHFRPAR